VNTRYREDDGPCEACWEQDLCTNYLFARGYGEKAIHGVKGGESVFFVFREEKGRKNNYVLWGMSTVDGIQGEHDGILRFKPFKPLPESRWVYGLTAESLVDTKWGNNTIRPIDRSKVEYLTELLEGGSDIPLDESSIDLESDLEGEQSLRRHIRLERQRSQKLRSAFIDSLDDLTCCVCGFDFGKTYGKVGRGFIEVHHLVPIGQLSVATRIRLKDLAAVCSNCHRMLHRKRGSSLTCDELRKRVLTAKRRSRRRKK